MNDRLIEFTVPGMAAPQGSKRLVRLKNGRTVMFDQCKRLKPWRAAVAYEAGRAWVGPPAAVACTISAEFVFERPKSHWRKAGELTKTAPLHPGKPDIDKLCRALLDGLTGVVMVDDSQVIWLNAHKRFGSQSETFVTISYAAR
jgi:Holliday junction resolvase RusA-like endonuclease